MGLIGIGLGGGPGLVLLFQSVNVSLVQQPVEESRRQCLVIGLGTRCIRQIAGLVQASLLVALGDHVESKVASSLLNGR